MARDIKALTDPNYEPPIRKRSSTTGATTVTTSTAPKKGPMSDYTGPKPGTPEFKAARKAGQTPIRDHIKAKMAARKAARAAKKSARPSRPSGSGGIVPPHMGGSPVPGTRPPRPVGPRPPSDLPRPGILSAASALAGAAKRKNPLTKR